MASLADEFLSDFADGFSGAPSSTINNNNVEVVSTNQPSHNNNNNKNGSEQNEDGYTASSFTTLLEEGHEDYRKLMTHVNRISQFSALHQSEQLTDTEYQYIVQSNQLLIQIEHEIQDIFKKVRDLYACKFPELETHVLNPLDYARVVKRIGYETDLSSVDMTDILPSSIIMIIRVTSSTSSFKQTNTSQVRSIVDRVLIGCDQILKLDEVKKQILEYVSSRMNALAPNLSAIVGTTIAAQLIGIAGGLEALSKIPSADLQLLGKEKKNQFIGTMTATTHGQADLRYLGYIANCDLLHQTPPHLRKKVGRLIALKCTLAVRVDLCRSSPDGSAGQAFREKIEAASQKLQEPAQGKQVKPLPAPDSNKKKTKRSGEKSKRMKELNKLSELQKKKNRMAFGTNAEEELDQQYGSSSGLGMIGAEGSRTLRLGTLTKKTIKGMNIGGTKTSTSGSATSYSGTATQLRTGLASSLAFTPVQGIELENPLNAQKRMQQATEKKRYFSNMSFFKEPEAPASKKRKPSQ